MSQLLVEVARLLEAAIVRGVGLEDIRQEGETVTFVVNDERFCAVVEHDEEVGE